MERAGIIRTSKATSLILDSDERRSNHATYPKEASSQEEDPATGNPGAEET